MIYQKFEDALDDAGISWIKEYRLFAEHVGPGKGLRQRLKDAGFRDFRYDYKIGTLLIEVQGYGHSHSGKGQQRDWQKNNDAVKLGYRLLYFPAQMVKTRPDIVIEDILECQNL